MLFTFQFGVVLLPQPVQPTVALVKPSAWSTLKWNTSLEVPLVKIPIVCVILLFLCLC